MFAFRRQFDFNDFGTEIDHQTGRLRPGQPLGEIENTNAFEDLGWMWHVAPPYFVSSPLRRKDLRGEGVGHLRKLGMTSLANNSSARVPFRGSIPGSCVLIMRWVQRNSWQNCSSLRATWSGVPIIAARPNPE